MPKSDGDGRAGAADSAEGRTARGAGSAVSADKVNAGSAGSARLAFIAGAGLVFGLALHKSGVYRSDVLQRQFLLPDLWRADNTMLAVFLAASATSTAAIAGLSVLGGEGVRSQLRAGGGKKCACHGTAFFAAPPLFRLLRTWVPAAPPCAARGGGGGGRGGGLCAELSVVRAVWRRAGEWRSGMKCGACGVGWGHVLPHMGGCGAREAAEICCLCFLRADLEGESLGLGAVVLGTGLLGAGMAISGACPGTVWAQLGAGNDRALAVLAGGVLGAFAFSKVEPQVRGFLRWQANVGRRALYTLLGVSPVVSALPLVAGMGALSYAVAEHVLPAAPGTLATVVSAAPGAGGVLGVAKWNPALAGVLLGSMQVALTLGAAKNLGASTSFAYLASWLDPFSPEARACREDFDAAAWQLLFVVAAAAGSALGAWTGGTWYTPEMTAQLPPTWQLALGGFVLLFGSRLANGCTSGHGITGVGHQSLHSLLGTASMFAGAILTKRLLAQTT
jgi:uncharacterized membrane protein YedE/YeeE